MYSRIYKITALDGRCYYGSTTSQLARRLACHKRTAREQPNRLVYRHVRDSGGWVGVTIQLLETCHGTYQERLERERHHMQLDDTNLNTRRPVITRAEALERRRQYRDAHKIEYKAYQKAYREVPAHKLKAKAYQASYTRPNIATARQSTPVPLR